MQSAAAFEPSVEAALARLDAARPDDYARTRNAIGGAVLRVSPYVTHGFVSVPDAIDRVAARHRLREDDRLVVEFAWREFFHHAWRHLGEAILDDLGTPPWPGTYARRVPADVLAASTGVPAIDESVRRLVRDGWLHNHARMWLASYLVHLRKCHWRAGADWMYGWLLDGDLASNHLSWQWVAGTFSSKPYLFDAGNVARWAPAHWHSPGTAVDHSYEALETIARSRPDLGPEPGERAREPVASEGLLAWPDAELLAGWPLADVERLRAAGVDRVRLVHPWDLGQAPGPPAPEAEKTLNIGWLMPSFHQRFAWSPARWRFVIGAMRPACPLWLVGEPARLREAGIRVAARATLNPAYREALACVDRPEPVARRFEDPEVFCRSFSRFWKRVSAGSARPPKPAKIR